MIEAGWRQEERLRRLRGSESLRKMVRETELTVSNLIAPIFVRHGVKVVEPVQSMPGVSRYSIDQLPDYLGRLVEVGIPAVLLFGIPLSKDEMGTEAYSGTGIIPLAIREAKRRFPTLIVAADVCLCEYTSHGHCGVIENGRVDNEKTIQLLAKAALEYARAGADIVAPSAMMDGQVRSIRMLLDDSGFRDTLVMGYSAKYASCFYGPFREAAGSSPSFGDRRGYQMDPANTREAMREIEADVREGADMIMVKPALPYLDVIAKARSRFDLPLVAYSVSGEYSMIKAAGANGWLDEKRAAMEVLTSIKRAGADVIITYFAEQAANWLAK
jgi:porphobilinogen synthase